MSLAENCNTLITTGVSLYDMPQIMQSVKEAVALRAQDPKFTNYPNSFSCSHCGNEHSLTAEEIRNILFNGSAAYDFTATYDEFLALINGVPAAAYSETTNPSTEFDISEHFIAKEEPEPEKEEIKTEDPATPPSDAEQIIKEADALIISGEK